MLYICTCDHEVYTCFFFFNDTATTEIYTLSLHDALPIYDGKFLWPGFGENSRVLAWIFRRCDGEAEAETTPIGDRKSTRLNSSHANISYAVFCLKKKKQT